jgi:hypothetical protein
VRRRAADGDVKASCIAAGGWAGAGRRSGAWEVSEVPVANHFGLC